MACFQQLSAGSERLSHAQSQRGLSASLSCSEGAFEDLAIQFDFVLARDVFWRRVWSVDPYFAIGDVLALAVGKAPITIDINIRPLPLSDVLAAECP